MISNKLPKREILLLALGEACVAVLICLGYLLVGKFNLTVVSGALLGGLVTVLNFLFLAISVNRALDGIMEGMPSPAEIERAVDEVIEQTVSDSETDDENAENETVSDEAARFAGENQAKLQNAVKLSFIIRSISMIAILVLAFITGIFDVIATVIPLFMQRPILTVSEMLRKEEK